MSNDSHNTDAIDLIDNMQLNADRYRMIMIKEELMSDTDFTEEIRERREAKRRRKYLSIQAEYDKNQEYQREIDKQNE